MGLNYFSRAGSRGTLKLTAINPEGANESPDQFRLRWSSLNSPSHSATLADAISQIESISSQIATTPADTPKTCRAETFTSILDPL